LGELMAASELRAAAAEARRESMLAAISSQTPPPSFRAALARPDVAIIAEVKRRSPSKGAINERIVAEEHAARYAAGGAAAISVLTEPTRFGGDLADLSAVSSAVRLPVLRKDFICREVQLLEARLGGAAAVLLIARGLRPRRIGELAAIAQEVGLDVLVEVRDEHELDLALRVPDGVVGVNARDLETLRIEPQVVERLIPLVPAGRLAVHESGIVTVDDVIRAAEHGADAVLVGSAVSAAIDGAAAVRTLVGVPRRSRG
jgi:indole-3-glycerol phosphate synthase